MSQSLYVDPQLVIVAADWERPRILKRPLLLGNNLTEMVHPCTNVVFRPQLPGTDAFSGS
jgi:hypothetical protein